MKAYSLGQDNESGRAVRSKIEATRACSYCGDAAGADEQLWERFWIVPARSRAARAPAATSPCSTCR